MRINTKTVWDFSGDQVVEIYNESYEYEGSVSEAKGGGGSCPPPDNTPQYTYDPNMTGNVQMMGGIGSLAAAGNNSQNVSANATPAQQVAAQTNYGQASPQQGAPMGPGAQFINPMDMMVTGNGQSPVMQPISQYDPSNPYQR